MFNGILHKNSNPTRTIIAQQWQWLLVSRSVWVDCTLWTKQSLETSGRSWSELVLGQRLHCLKEATLAISLPNMDFMYNLCHNPLAAVKCLPTVVAASTHCLSFCPVPVRSFKLAFDTPIPRLDFVHTHFAIPQSACFSSPAWSALLEASEGHHYVEICTKHSHAYLHTPLHPPAPPAWSCSSDTTPLWPDRLLGSGSSLAPAAAQGLAATPQHTLTATSCHSTRHNQSQQHNPRHKATTNTHI